MENVYCLFEGRHDLPNNKGALFTGFNFLTFEPEKSENFETAVSEYSRGHDLTVIVTGLTPALTWFLSYLIRETDSDRGELILLHFDRDTQEYIGQKMW